MRTPSTPARPWLARTSSQARHNTSGRTMRSYRAWNRRVGSCLAFTYSARWSFRSFSGVTRLTPIPFSRLVQAHSEPGPLSSPGIARVHWSYEPLPLLLDPPPEEALPQSKADDHNARCTARSSSGRNVRPSAAWTPSTSKKALETARYGIATGSVRDASGRENARHVHRVRQRRRQGRQPVLLPAVHQVRLRPGGARRVPDDSERPGTGWNPAAHRVFSGTFGPVSRGRKDGRVP